MLSFLMGIVTLIATGKRKLSERASNLKAKRQNFRDKIDGITPADAVDTNQKPDKKESVKTKVLAVITAVSAFFEMLPVFFSLMSWVMIIVCVFVILIIIFMIMALLAQQKEYYEKAEEKKAQEDCSAPVADIGGVLAWSDSELASRGVKLTDKEKNMYRMGIFARKAIEGYGGKELAPNAGVSTAAKIRMLIGKTSVESSMNFGTDKDISLYPTTARVNDSGFGFMGIKASKNLNSYYSSSVASKIKSQYTPKSSPSYTAQYAPWGTAMAGSHFMGNVGEVKSNGWDKKIDKVADDWGIKANKKEFKDYATVFLGQVRYHSGNRYNYPQEVESYINFYAALFVATSDNDSERTFFAWTIPGTKATFGESEVRTAILGSGGNNRLHGKAPSSLKLAGNSTPIYLNGKKLTKPVWSYLYEKYGDKSGMKLAWTAIQHFSSLGSGGFGDRPMNYHYGFTSFLQGNRVESTLSAKMGIVGEGEKTDLPSGSCAEEDEGKTTVTPGNFKPTPGKGQAIVDGKPMDEWIKSWYAKNPSNASHVKKLQSKWGTSSHLDGKKSVAAKFGYVDKDFGVPFYGQGSKYGEKYGTDLWHPSGGAFNRSGCMVYAHAYAASALTGRMINGAEMGSLMIATNNLLSVGIRGSGMPETYKKLGLSATWKSSGRSAFGNHNKPTKSGQDIATTVRNGGVAVVRFGGPPFASGSNHFVTITGVTVKKGVPYYRLYTSTSLEKSSQDFTKEYLMNNRLHSDVVMVWKKK